MVLEAGLVLGVTILAVGGGTPSAFTRFPAFLPAAGSDAGGFLLQGKAPIAETKWCPNEMKVLLLSRKRRWVEKNQISPIKRLAI